MLRTSREFKRVVKEAEKQGWEVSQSRSGHLRWASPTGALVFSSFSPSDVRAEKNLVRDLRKFGFIEVKKQ